MREVFCSVKIGNSECCGPLITCFVNQTIESEAYVQESKIDNTVERIFVRGNGRVKYLPKQMGEKFPNLKDVFACCSGLTVVRKYYFEGMQNLRNLNLRENEIVTIEPDSFRDLISLEQLSFPNNKIETLDEKLFVTMVKLVDVWLSNNKIKFLSPTTFKIPDGQLSWVDLRNNVCVSRGFNANNFAQLEAQIRANCTQ